MLKLIDYFSQLEFPRDILVGSSNLMAAAICAERFPQGHITTEAPGFL